MTPMPAAVDRVAEVVGWGLIHFLWQGTVLAVLLGLTLLVLPRGFARARYIAGCVTMALMLLAPALTLWQLADPHQPASPYFEDVSAAALVPTAPQGLPLPAGSRAVLADTLSRERSLESDRRLTIDTTRLLPWLVLAWAIGVTACSLRLAGGWWQARRLVRNGTRPVAARWDHVKGVLALRLGLKRPVRLLESTRLQVPVVVGWLRPVLLVPTAVLGGLSPQQLEAVIAHELAHIRRHDYLVNLLQSAVETLLFYHPAVWWVSSAVRTEREHCCDDLAVVACGDAVLYARALTAIETLRNEEMGVAMAVTGSPLLSRVRRLLGATPPARTASSGWIVALLTAVMVSVAGVTSWIRGVPVELTEGARPQATVSQATLPSAPPPLPPTDLLEAAAVEEAAESAARTMERAMAEQERALTAAARALERAESARTARDASAEARQIGREAMRQAREMVRSAQLAARDATRAMRDAQRAARSSSWSWWSDEAPEPPGAPEPPEPPAPPSDGTVWPTPPPPPVPPAPDAPPPPPTPPSPAAAPVLPAPPAPPVPPVPPAAGFWHSGDKTSSWNTTHTSNGTTLKINARGQVEFTDEETDVKGLSPGGWFIVDRRVGGVGGFIASDVRRFEARERNGTIERTFTVDGRTLGADEGRKWLATFLPDVLRNMAVNADRRVARQLARGGPALVLEEIGKTGNAFAKSVYLRQLYAQAQLDPATLTRSLQLSAREISPDFELAQALKAAAEHQAIESALPAFLEASRAIESDFEQRHVLSKALGRRGLTAAGAGQIFTTAARGAGGAGIDSDFELAQLLMQAARGGQVTDVNVSAYLEAARGVQSDFERRQVVQALSKVTLSDAAMAGIVTLAAGIGSDFEKSEALVGLSANASAGAATRKALADAAMGIGSEFERGRALSALARAGVLTAAH